MNIITIQRKQRQCQPRNDTLVRVGYRPRDWLHETRGLRADQHGVYFILIGMIDQQGGSILFDRHHLARCCGTTPSLFDKTLRLLIELGKIDECHSNGKIHLCKPDA